MNGEEAKEPRDVGRCNIGHGISIGMWTIGGKGRTGSVIPPSFSTYVDQSTNTYIDQSGNTYVTQ